MPKAPTLREASRPAYTRARKNRPLGATPDLRGAWPSYLDLGAKLDDAVRRNSEELGRPCRDAREAGVQALARSCHPGAGAGFDVAWLKSRAEQRIAATVKVVAIHEVGLDGFWIHRLLGANGIMSRPQRPPMGVLGYGMQLCLSERGRQEARRWLQSEGWHPTSARVARSPRRAAPGRSYRGACADHSVDSTTPIFANATGDRSLLVPGAAVFVIASKHDDGTLTSTRLYAEKDGIKPPM